MDDQSAHERIMDIIDGGPNNVPTFTDEECSQADGFLNIPTADEGNTNVVDEEGSTHAGNEDVEDDNAEGSHEVHNKLSLLIL